MKSYQRIEVTLIVFMILSLANSVPSQQPVIGIFTQTHNSLPNETYIAASYVKYIQMSGAQVVPIFSMSNQSYLANLLPKLNGVLFPGGGMEFDISNKWTSNADYILKYAIEQNKKKNIFPVWGTCLGFQLLNYLTSGYDPKVLSPVRGQAPVVNTINITSTPSYLFKNIPQNIRNKATKGTGILYYNHHWAVLPETHTNNPLLRNFWTIVAQTKSPYNQLFIAVMQSKQYPFFGVQFHPEKNPYQWKVYADRSNQGVQIAQMFSNLFIQTARGSPNKFQSIQEFTKFSIYNYKTSQASTQFTQIYIFSQNTKLNQQSLRSQ